jgi:prepilin-type N-terminal cleavage/methylation domain-containing protein
MIITTRSPAPDAKRRQRGFTMVELMISATLGSFLLLAVVTSFLFMGRSGSNMQNYVEMEVQARRAIETFAEDVRMAKDATWNTSKSLTLTVVTSTGTTATRTYTYDSAAGTFSRVAGTTTQRLITGISTFSFTAYKINTATIDLSDSTTLASASSLTKQVQISLRTIRSTRTVTDATNSVISARFILRNKKVTA